ncbi:MAG: hypothetical protein II718_09360 [Clostridiales bacterium]|nr:hypothetical protein [Clostridiales bacterium]
MTRAKRITVRFTAVLMAASFALSSTSCSDFLKEIAKDKVTTYVTDELDSMMSDPEAYLTKNSSGDYISSLSDEQKDIALQLFSDYSYEIESVKLNDKRTKATVTVEIPDVYIMNDELLTGTPDEIIEKITENDPEDQTVVLTVKRNDNSWKIEDVSAFEKMFFSGYSMICVFDEDGNPININEAFIESIYVDSCWYDAISGNPVSFGSTTSAMALHCVFYFNQPMTMTFEAVLYKNDTQVQTMEVVLDGNITAECDFMPESGDEYQSGTYRAELIYGDTVIAVSEDLNVN